MGGKVHTRGTPAVAKRANEQGLPFPNGPRRLDVAALEPWLWEAACVIRGPLDAPKFKDYILPLIFLKRLSDVYDDELAHLAKDFGRPLGESEPAKHEGRRVPQRCRPRRGQAEPGLLRR